MKCKQDLNHITSVDKRVTKDYGPVGHQAEVENWHLERTSLKINLFRKSKFTSYTGDGS